MKIDYILTAFSPAMFGQKATVHVSIVSLEEAQSMVDGRTQLMATRIPHEMLGRTLFPVITSAPVRYADLRPGTTALQLNYRGPPLGNDGVLPPGASVTPYLIEVEKFQER